MKILFKAFSCSLLLGASMAANADWSGSFGYASVSEDIESTDISVGIAYGSIGYSYDNGDFTITPELRLGTGIRDDYVEGVNVEVDSFVAASVRGQYNVHESFGLFVQPSYARLEATARIGSRSASASEWEFGLGGGASLKISEGAYVEALYESFDASDVLSVGVRINF